MVSIDDVIEQKLDAHPRTGVAVLRGRGARQRGGVPARRRKDAAARKAWFRKEHYWASATPTSPNQYRDALVTWYGPEKGKAVKYAEAFEICEYGRRVNADADQEAVPVLRVSRDCETSGASAGVSLAGEK